MTTRSNAEWLDALKSSGDEQAAAIADLRAHLLRAAMYSLHRRRGTLGHLAPAERTQLAEDCAQDALLAILQHLTEFRGESRFTTWIYTFAVNAALVAARREGWKRVPLDHLLENPDLHEGPMWHDRTATDPARGTLQREAWAAIDEAIEQHLTRRQRQVLKAIVFESVPLDEVARHWGSNRNAVYKVLHDARRKLKAHLQQRGFAMKEIRETFSGER